MPTIMIATIGKFDSNCHRYSTIWLGKALPEDGKLITLELNEKNAEVSKFRGCLPSFSHLTHYYKVARKNIANAGLSSKIEIIIGKAIDSMKTFRPEPPFDLIFIDADKPSSKLYFMEAKRLVRTGGVIVSRQFFQSFLSSYFCNPYADSR